MKIKEIADQKTSMGKIFKELIDENLAIDLDKEELKDVLEMEVNSKILSQIQIYIKSNKNSWDYFGIMKILGII